MAPDPTTIIVSGSLGSTSACFEEITCSPSMGDERHFAGPCSGGEDDVVGFVLRAVHVDPAVSFQFCEAVDQLHVVLFEQEQHAFVHRFGHAARAGYDLFEVGPHFACEVESVMFGRLAIVVNLGALEQRFGRDATPVEAYAAGLGTLYDSHFLPSLSSADGGYVTARTAADHNDIVFHIFVCVY